MNAGGREPNRMVPTPLLRRLREAQRRKVDSAEVKAIVHQIDRWLKGR